MADLRKLPQHKGATARFHPPVAVREMLVLVLAKDNHPYTAATLDNLAGLYRDRGKYAKAEPLYKRALEIREKALSKDHPDTANTLKDWGSGRTFEKCYCGATA